MSQLTNSIVRGFGFTLGRMGAQAAVQTLTKKPKKNYYSGVDPYYCYTNLGFEENDIDIKFDYNQRSYRGFFNWVLIILGAMVWILIPYLNIFIWVLSLRSFSKNHYMHFYKMVYKTFKITDRRYKEGYREVVSLKPEYTESRIDSTYPKNMWITFNLIGLIISILWTIKVYNVLY